MVGLGYGDASASILLDDFEIIDLKEPVTTCKTFKALGRPNAYSEGFLGLQNEPFICGGQSSPYFCYFYGSSGWLEGPTFNIGREGLRASTFFNEKGKNILLMGSAFTSKAELLTTNGWEYTTQLPEPLTYVCIIQIDHSHALVTGGNPGTGVSATDRTFLLDFVSTTWTETGRMMEPRDYHSCSKIKSDEGVYEEAYLVIGGKNNGNVEILLNVDSQWQSRNKFLTERNIYNAVALQEPGGGVLLIGGQSDAVTLSYFLYMLPNGGVDANWERLSIKLKSPRHSHVAFYIPDVYCNMSVEPRCLKWSSKISFFSKQSGLFPKSLIKTQSYLKKT